MPLHVGLLVEGHAANRAHVRPYAHVREQVPLEIVAAVGARERFAALNATHLQRDMALIAGSWDVALGSRFVVI